jgi:hypothetical protein
MLTVHFTKPTSLTGFCQTALKPGSAITNSPTGTFVKAGSPAEFNGSNRLRITNIAKNKLSDGHNVDFKKLSNE